MWSDTRQTLDVSRFLGPATQAGETHYVGLLIDLATPDLDTQGAKVNLAYNGPIQPPNILGQTRGLVQLTTLRGGGFELQPISQAMLTDSHLPLVDLYSPQGLTYQTLLFENEVKLTLGIQLPRTSGLKARTARCDLGTYLMPFKLTIK